jgi:LmbE family N-acetylglucosaminyl deacetylase
MRSRADRSWQAVSQTLLASSQNTSLRIAVLAAHPDDETIGASSLLARFPDTAVIYLTDGAPRDSKLWSPDFRGTREEYASLRRAEAARALSIVGVSPHQIHCLDAVDQEAIFNAGNLARSLTEALATFEPDVLITHPYEGGHPDHDSAALIARLANFQLDQEQTPSLVEMTSYYARDCQCITGQFLEFGGQREDVCVELSPNQRERKRKMFSAHASQKLVLSSFGTDRERFRKAPDYDFSRPPHEGKLWFECMGWPMTAEQWRALAARCMARQEYACH